MSQTARTQTEAPAALAVSFAIEADYRSIGAFPRLRLVRVNGKAVA